MSEVRPESFPSDYLKVNEVVTYLPYIGMPSFRRVT